MLKVTKLSILAGSLAFATFASGAVSFFVSAGGLRTTGGGSLSSGFLLLAVDKDGDGFVLPDDGDFLPGTDDEELARWNFSEGGNANIPGEFTATALVSPYNPDWEGESLALFWFPSLDKSATAPGDGTNFGVYSDPLNESTGDAWTMPADGTPGHTLQLFAEGSIMNSTSFVSEFVAEASLVETTDPLADLTDVMTDPEKTSATSNTIGWDPATGAQAYTVQRRVVGETNWETLGSVSGTTDTYLDDMLTPGLTYEYQVIAENGLEALPSFADGVELFSERSVFASVSARSFVQEGHGNTRRMFGQVDIVGNDPTKNVIVQGSGPALTALYGTPEALPDPSLKIWNHPNPVFADRVLVGINDNWMDQTVPDDALKIDEVQGNFSTTTHQRRVNEFENDPPSNDAAWVGAAETGVPYTFMLSSVGVSGQPGPDGVAHAAITSAEGGTAFGNSDNRIVGLDTRGFLGAAETRSRKMFGEFLIEGAVSKTVLIRGIGPHLAYNGLADYAEDPLIKLWYHPDPLNDFANRTLVASNDNWEVQIPGGIPGATVITDPDSIDRALQSFKHNDSMPRLFDEGSKDCALLVTLDPGVYTFMLYTPDNQDSGIGLTGVYEIELENL